ncbi:major facilitator superfamily domain-containing protein [Dipodascopsis tothii]|uniref:major facilitator superfamily domain-containing protein n=1 Tax=Dipodascopsis tothii TaxID=44089 RepID=UPI0034CE1181
MPEKAEVTATGAEAAQEDAIGLGDAHQIHAVNSLRIESLGRPSGELHDVELGDELTAAEKEAQAQPYCVHPRWKVNLIVAVAILTGFMSPFTINIYFPELTEISQALGVSVEAINLTVTLYLVFQGTTPTIWSAFADSLGRRPVYLVTSAIYVVANIAISINNTYPGLMVLRVLQATGSAAAVSISAGTVADIVEPSRRGTYMGLVLSVSMIAPAIAPVIGGLCSLASYGWRTVFLLLLALSVVDFALIAVWFPETSRHIVGNGSIRPTGINRSLIDIVREWRHGPPTDAVPAGAVKEPPRKFMNPLRMLGIVLHPDVAIILATNCTFYSAFSATTVGVSSKLHAIYGLSTLKVGLCYLPFGTGCSVGSMLCGRMMDRAYRREVARVGFDSRDPERGHEFPIERVRLQCAWLFVPFLVGAIAGFGWSLRRDVSVAVPLVMFALVGFGVMSVFNVVQVLIVDLYPKQAASAQAVNNMIRCLGGAVASAVIEYSMNALGVSWAYTLAAALCAVMVPLLWLEQKHGMRWRLARFHREREQAAAADKATAAAAAAAEKPETTP